VTEREDWSASNYLRFEEERTRPAADLLARVPTTDPRLVVDLGCGPGNSTELLVRRFPAAAVSGVDLSPDMLGAARERLPGVTFVEADVARWEPDRSPDLIFANAVLQWLPDHEVLLPRLMRWLAPGGALAVQLPDNLAEPSHVAMAEIARAGRWSVPLQDAEQARTVILPPGGYYDLVSPFASHVDIWRTVYQHPVRGAAAIAAFFGSTGLKPYLDRLPPDEREIFAARYAERMRDAYPIRADGLALLSFPRLFVVAVRR
jgi:trans-aconitate 2-methyltransferase